MSSYYMIFVDSNIVHGKARVAYVKVAECNVRQRICHLPV